MENQFTSRSAFRFTALQRNACSPAERLSRVFVKLRLTPAVTLLLVRKSAKAKATTKAQKLIRRFRVRVAISRNLNAPRRNAPEQRARSASVWRARALRNSKTLFLVRAKCRIRK